ARITTMRSLERRVRTSLMVRSSVAAALLLAAAARVAQAQGVAYEAARIYPQAATSPLTCGPSSQEGDMFGFTVLAVPVVSANNRSVVVGYNFLSTALHKRTSTQAATEAGAVVVFYLDGRTCQVI